MRRILWFRRDLRTDDNPLLSLEGEVLPIFIFDPAILSGLARDDRRVTYLFEALLRLKASLRLRGLDLILFHGRPAEVFSWLLENGAFDEVCASGDYDRYARERDRDVSHLLPFRYLNDTYIFEPDEVLKNDGSPYLVFTPFYNRAKALFTPIHMKEHLPASQQLLAWESGVIHVIADQHRRTTPISLESLGFSPAPLAPYLSPSEKLVRFSPLLSCYATERDFPALGATSHLSADLRFGMISIRAVLRWLAGEKKKGTDTEPFFRELVFREFYAMLLYHFPALTAENFRYLFAGVWNGEYAEAFYEGRTGVPLVDAGIRELLETGQMHNRVRMVCASFWTKNLLLPWQEGEKFFAAHLLDYDAASNILSWQWSAGTGVDPQPYFRIFNPYTQGKKFDYEGEYIRRWIPELSGVEAKILHDESKLSRLMLSGYPPPIVEHKSSSQRALEHFKEVLY
ncbi:MAG: deoxyribodipyrimidine photo-lyase [Campylobacterales bacterium]|nr:deoxyribodipyrimidine photo-lyase [Campylobacterales bacterium]